jgi:hypothetical protein
MCSIRGSFIDKIASRVISPTDKQIDPAPSTKQQKEIIDSDVEKLKNEWLYSLTKEELIGIIIQRDKILENIKDFMRILQVTNRQIYNRNKK